MGVFCRQRKIVRDHDRSREGLVTAKRANPTGENAA
jgi:hypothetical protein